MPTNIDRYKKDLESLVSKGNKLHLAIYADCAPEEFNKRLQNIGKTREKITELRKGMPSFRETYQSWYSEALALVRQLLPDRLSDFIGHYQKPKGRKNVTYENYRIDDYLQGLTVTQPGSAWEQPTKIVGLDAAVPHFRQQLAILESVRARFESSLFDIRQLVHADIFDSELDAASELLKNKFTRAAGAVAGVVLEKHLGQVCDNHNITVTKKNPAISDLNDTLKNGKVIEVPDWRFIQHLGDLRNLCDHDRKTEPTGEQVKDLIAGVAKITKTLF